MLTLEGVTAGYGGGRVLQGIDLEIAAGTVTALLGRNGMGKSTTINCIIGLLKIDSGNIEFDGVNLGSIPSYKIARLGIGLVPEDRHIFPNLNVTENLTVAAANYSQSSSPWTLERIFSLFPRLQERCSHAGNQLSGGEQQMLAIGR
ncbi:MAG: ATP-binding cassette domain-containing protein, partial [Alphaproteobacteria bacterium]|nr:ATP-binding cassette domain-containing protein [Alphaproteobacteria bacterium]